MNHAPPALIYKILQAPAWAAARHAGTYAGSADDMRDGFIHMSTAAQLDGTLQRHFSGKTGLLLVEFKAAILGETLRWEPSRGGDLFPHVYGALDPIMAGREWPLAVRDDGVHQLPPELRGADA